jgi:hypothetical protein
MPQDAPQLKYRREMQKMCGREGHEQSRRGSGEWKKDRSAEVSDVDATGDELLIFDSGTLGPAIDHTSGHTSGGND